MLDDGRQANPADMDRGEITSVSGGVGALPGGCYTWNWRCAAG